VASVSGRHSGSAADPATQNHASSSVSNNGNNKKKHAPGEGGGGGEQTGQVQRAGLAKSTTTHNNNSINNEDDDEAAVVPDSTLSSSSPNPFLRQAGNYAELKIKIKKLQKSEADSITEIATLQAEVRELKRGKEVYRAQSEKACAENKRLLERNAMLQTQLNTATSNKDKIKSDPS
jgi:hypothetical protein